jgi:hypothetical protein
MQRIVFLVLFNLALFSLAAPTVRAQDDQPSFDKARIELFRSLSSYQLVAASMLLTIIAQDADCTDVALADSLEAAAREEVRRLQSQIRELNKESPNLALFSELARQALDTNQQMDELLRKCNENERQYRELFASVPNIRDFGELKVGQAYRVASEYCWMQHDLRETFELYAASGRRQAVKLWRAKTAAKLCVEDTPTDSTEFRVVNLTDTLDLKGEKIYIAEVMIGDLTAFMTSPIPVIAAN